MKIPSFSILQTLRGRLTLWYLLSTIFTFVVLATLFSGVLWVTLHNQIDHHLHIVITEAKQIVERYSDGERDQLLKNLVNGQGMTVVLLSADSSPVLQTNSPDVAVMSEHQIQRVLLTSESTSTAVDTPVHFTIQNIRFATMKARVNGGQGILAVGYSEEVIDQTFWNLMLVVGGVIIVVSAPLSVIGYVLLKKYLSPLENIAVTAKGITHFQKLDARVSEKQSTQELRSIAKAFNQMLEQIQQVFTKEHQFFSDTAHTLKTPLAVLRSRVEALPETVMKQKQELLSNIDDLATMIQDLLLISRLETQPSINWTVIPISALVREVAELTEVAGNSKQLTITMAIQDNITIKGDLSVVKKILSNLAENALKYSHKEGRVIFSLQKEKGKVILRVKDFGIGIASEDQQHIFDRFYRGKTALKTPGTGLGLAIAKAAIEGMGGSIEVSSKINKGTTFTVIFHS